MLRNSSVTDSHAPQSAVTTTSVEVSGEVARLFSDEAEADRQLTAWLADVPLRKHSLRPSFNLNMCNKVSRGFIAESVGSARRVSRSQATRPQNLMRKHLLQVTRPTQTNQHDLELG